MEVVGGSDFRRRSVRSCHSSSSCVFSGMFSRMFVAGRQQEEDRDRFISIPVIVVVRSVVDLLSELGRFEHDATDSGSLGVSCCGPSPSLADSGIVVNCIEEGRIEMDLERDLDLVIVVGGGVWERRGEGGFVGGGGCGALMASSLMDSSPMLSPLVESLDSTDSSGYNDSNIDLASIICMESLDIPLSRLGKARALARGRKGF